MPRPYESSTISRERNRIHARKTRQRKKEQMQGLQNRAEELKEEQIRLKQCINEKNTASILVGLFSTDGPSSSSGSGAEDPMVEELLKRPVEQIPDSTKLPELPALILPGHHNSKKIKTTGAAPTQQPLPDDGIDYDLLGKDRSKCSAEELDRIRRERNRMHAKRTRDRKRLFMEEMAELCKKLEGENVILQNHLNRLNGVPLVVPPPPPPASSQEAGVGVPPPSTKPKASKTSKKKKASTAVKVSPPLTSAPSIFVPPMQEQSDGGGAPLRSQTQAFHKKKRPSPAKRNSNAVSSRTTDASVDQIKTLLQAAGAYGGKSASPVSAENSVGGSVDGNSSPIMNNSNKRQRLDSSGSEQSSSANSSNNKGHRTAMSSSATVTAIGC